MTREKFINTCDQIIAFSYYALIYFLPISIALSESFAGATLFFFFVKRGLMFSIDIGQVELANLKSFGTRVKKIIVTFLRAFKPVDSYLSRPLGFFILICALSILVSDYLTTSLQGFFFKVLQWTFLYFVFIEAIKTKKRLTIFISVFMVSALVVSLNGLVQYFSGEGFIHHHPFAARINSSFKHPNDFGAYLTLLCPFLLCLLVNYRFVNKEKTGYKDSKGNSLLKKFLAMKTFLLTLFVLVITCLGLTLSRGAWYSFFIALIFLGLQNKKNLFFSLIIIGLFIYVFSPVLEGSRNISIFSDNVHIYNHYIDEEKLRLSQVNNGAISEEKLRLHQENNGNAPVESEGAALSQRKKENNHVGLIFRLKAVLKSIKISSGSGRQGFWKEALLIIKESPILGTGVNTYSKVAHQRKIRAWYPHNSYLHMAAEIGILGLFVFMWGLVSLFKNTLRNIKLIKDNPM